MCIVNALGVKECSLDQPLFARGIHPDAPIDKRIAALEDSIPDLYDRIQKLENYVGRMFRIDRGDLSDDIREA